MSCLDATFTLTPQTPLYSNAGGDQAQLYCYGADFNAAAPTDLPSLYTSNRFYFSSGFACDPNLDYTQWSNRRRARFLELAFTLPSRGANKQLALIFGFDVVSPATLFGSEGRVLVYSDAAELSSQTLVYGDNQFLLEIDSVDQPLNLYFIHASGNWFFRGISAYVV
jgi:hypothetical protein